MNKRSPVPEMVLWLFPVAVLALIVGLVVGLFALGRSLDSGTLGYRLVVFIAVPLVIAVVAGCGRRCG
ncbi:hypothetical protein G7085_00290 [Tessaracoccus sp. HDW20]|uniref:hypothetical protein n=1 Tax=Tessaracoccus coleopterorum TaxID=2714950 RepID=UPI0018D342AA|nr:hypothetical protein [Tessaracoccus coleopterorum]NHB83661.1 hypothetical protein [Tessaracoccus coleopterorum]